jgi:TonB family protein
MNRIAIAAALVLSPLMIHAQSAGVAQSQPLMVSAAAKTGTVRVSTGVVAPKLVKTISIADDGSRISQFDTATRTVVVGMTVDAAGKPSDLKIVKSLGETMDKNVLAAISEYRFLPGTVSGQATSFPVNLEIEIQK